jgi:hypothetical protein
MVVPSMFRGARIWTTRRWVISQTLDDLHYGFLLKEKSPHLPFRIPRQLYPHLMDPSTRDGSLHMEYYQLEKAGAIPTEGHSLQKPVQSNHQGGRM